MTPERIDETATFAFSGRDPVFDPTAGAASRRFSGELVVSIGTVFSLGRRAGRMDRGRCMVAGFDVFSAGRGGRVDDERLFAGHGGVSRWRFLGRLRQGWRRDNARPGAVG